MRTDVQNNAILGIHVAAVMKNGLSMFHFVTAAELIRATSSVVNVTLQESPHINYGADVKYQSDLPDNHQFYYLGTTDKKHRVFQPVKTDLKPSLLYEAIGPHITEPSILSKNDERIPAEEKENFWPLMFEGYANYTNLTVNPASLSARKADWAKVVKVWDKVVTYIIDPKTQPDAVKIMSARVGIKPETYLPLLKGTKLLTLEEGKAIMVKADGFKSLYGSTKIVEDFNLRPAFDTG